MTSHSSSKVDLALAIEYLKKRRYLIAEDLERQEADFPCRSYTLSVMVDDLGEGHYYDIWMAEHKPPAPRYRRIDFDFAIAPADEESMPTSREYVDRVNLLIWNAEEGL